MEKNETKHLTDEEFFTFIRFRDLMLRDGYFSIGDLSINSDSDNVYNRLNGAYGDWLDALVLNVPKGETFSANLEELKEKAKENFPFHDDSDFLPILDKLEKTDWITFEELGIASWLWYELYELVEFQTPEYNLSNEQIKELKAKVSDYLELFRNDELKTQKLNFYRFEIQKKLLIDWVENNDMVSKYGNSFIVSIKSDRQGVLKGQQDFAIIQTAYALEEMDYLTVNNVWLSRQDNKIDIDNDRYILNLNIDLHEQFLRELNEEYQEKNPTIHVESYDAKKGLLKFAGKEIFLIKGSKKTDAARLVETLITADTEEWLERGEVFADWGMTKEDRELAAKNKIYFAKNSANDAVAKLTGIDDFIEGATKRFRINPRYRKTKVDK